MRKGSNRRTVKRRREVFLKKICITLALAGIVLTGSIVGGSRLVSAHDNAAKESVEYKYYKSIEVSRGDSLWSIAKEYMSQNYDSIYDYIDELKQMNHLDSDDIHAGQYHIMRRISSNQVRMFNCHSILRKLSVASLVSY